MRFWSFGVGAVMALAAAGAAEAADAPFQPRPKTEVGFKGAVDRLWSGSVVTEQCVTSRRRRLASLFQPKLRMAAYERRGELIGEFASPAPAPHVVETARRCAAAAGETTTTRTLLAGGPAGFSTFQTAFSACMTERQAGQAVGAMTLWIDNRCDW
ncbi:hypothetical protein [Phenylobacterium sp.]|uniref:hypothetical protein n=1 Tax=Phenylobacterium sp. TaxID=1871053 RepID=UPI0035B1EC17